MRASRSIRGFIERKAQLRQRCQQWSSLSLSLSLSLSRSNMTVSRHWHFEKCSVNVGFESSCTVLSWWNISETSLCRVTKPKTVRSTMKLVQCSRCCPSAIQVSSVKNRPTQSLSSTARCRQRELLRSENKRNICMHVPCEGENHTTRLLPDALRIFAFWLSSPVCLSNKGNLCASRLKIPHEEGTCEDALWQIPPGLNSLNWFL